jgi:tetratricopeptide (TPR) repeat protein
MVSRERFDVDEIARPTRNTMPEQRSRTVAQWFAEGNYVMAARKGDPDEWQTHAAMGLVGKTQEAIEGLSRFDSPDARFYSAVASWIGGDEVLAARTLERIETPHARNLLALIRKPRIRVLTQLPWSSTAGPGPLVGARQDAHFDVQNIGFHPQDLLNEPYADVRRFYNPQHPPDFYLCGMVEWHVIPPNLHELPCPTFGATSDYDLHIQTIHPWLKLFDEIVVADEWEHGSLRRLVTAPVATFPKLCSFLGDLPPPNRRERDIDVFQSGSILHPYHRDKTEFVQAILRMPDVKAMLINGFVQRDEYYETLARSKVSFTYVRHPGGISSRALEALAMGCVVLVQHECLMRLYFTEQEGVLGYEPRTGEFGEVLKSVLENWVEFQARARRGSEIVRREFALPLAMSHCLRFLTFLAAKPRPDRQRRRIEGLSHKRSIVWKGWLPGGPEVMEQIRRCNLARWQETLERKQSPQLLNDMAREVVLEYAAKTRSSKADAPELLACAFRLYHAGLNRFPKALVLRFNFMRTAFHYGWPSEVSRALQLARDTVGRPSSGEYIDPLDDIFPWDLYNTFFNYRAYLEGVEAKLKGDKSSCENLTRLIYASLHHYLGCYLDDQGHLERAVALDPEFPYYQLSLARHCVRSGKQADYSLALALLERLGDESLLFTESYALLGEMAHISPEAQGYVARLEPVVAKGARECSFVERITFDPIQPASRFSRTYLRRKYWRLRWRILQVFKSSLGPEKYARIRTLLRGTRAREHS